MSKRHGALVLWQAALPSPPRRLRVFQYVNKPQTVGRSSTISHCSSSVDGLDLGHVRATAGAASAAAQVDSRSTGHEDRDEERSHVAGPGEPEESNRGLGLATALLPVLSAIGDFIALEVRLWK